MRLWDASVAKRGRRKKTNSSDTSSTSSVARIPLTRSTAIRRRFSQLPERWLLDDYFVGPENHLLNHLLDDQTVAHLSEFSPICLYGDSGVGKTALAITLATRFSKATSARPVILAYAADFSKQFTEAIEIDDVSEFRSRYRGCKLLFLDNVHLLATKPASQVELAATLDALAELGVPVILTSNALPASIGTMHNALVSRILGGFSIALSRPAAETALAILNQLYSQSPANVDLAELVSRASALRCPTLDVAAWAKLYRIAGQCISADSGNQVDWEVFSKLAQQHFEGNPPEVAEIARVVARKMKIRIADMRASTRQANVVRARGLAMYLARCWTSQSLLSIGSFFGGRDHTTVLHSCRKIEGLLATDSELVNLQREIQLEVLKV